MIETARLTLRPWREADRRGWLAMMADPEVATWLGGVLHAPQAGEAFDRLKASVETSGLGMWAAERTADGELVGSIGVRRVPAERNHPMGGMVEVGWRLKRAAWGFGYASEGAAAALSWAFANLDISEIVAYTSRANARSRGVMRRIGMIRDPARDFDHPSLAEGHPLRRHIVYKMISDRAARGKAAGDRAVG
ncbi:MAG: GNAT family N-acetyltransferase [Caulobacteraceae bacterium]